MAGSLEGLASRLVRLHGRRRLALVRLRCQSTFSTRTAPSSSTTRTPPPFEIGSIIWPASPRTGLVGRTVAGDERRDPLRGARRGCDARRRERGGVFLDELGVGCAERVERAAPSLLVGRSPAVPRRLSAAPARPRRPAAPSLRGRRESRRAFVLPAARWSRRGPRSRPPGAIRSRPPPARPRA
jgi:hypothetical protein